MRIHTRRHLQAGFTFMELVVAILILGLLAAIAVPSYLRFAETARENTTKANLKTTKNNINLFHMEHGQYPTKLEDLVERPKGEAGKGWKPYLEKFPKDGWNSEFYYKVTPGGSHPYELYSYGTNGPEGSTSEEHISVWDL